MINKRIMQKLPLIIVFILGIVLIYCLLKPNSNPIIEFLAWYAFFKSLYSWKSIYNFLKESLILNNE